MDYSPHSLLDCSGSKRSRNCTCCSLLDAPCVFICAYKKPCLCVCSHVGIWPETTLPVWRRARSWTSYSSCKWSYYAHSSSVSFHLQGMSKSSHRVKCLDHFAVTVESYTTTTSGRSALSFRASQLCRWFVVRAFPCISLFQLFSFAHAFLRHQRIGIKQLDGIPVHHSAAYAPRATVSAWTCLMLADCWCVNGRCANCNARMIADNQITAVKEAHGVDSLKVL